MPAAKNPPAWRLHVAIALTFVALTAIVTYPQVRGFATSVPYHSDPYFSMWRLALFRTILFIQRVTVISIRL